MIGKSRRSLIHLVLVFVSILDIPLAFGGAIPIQEAHQSYQKKDYHRVTELLMPALADLKKDEFLILGKSFDHLNKAPLAVKVYLTAVSKLPGDSELKSLLGYEQFRSNHVAEAISTLKEVTEADKKYLPAYEFLIQIFEKRQNRYELGLIYQDLLERIGEKPEFVAKMCENSVLDSRYELALKYCQLGATMSPTDPISIVYLGLVYRETGKTKEAEAQLKKAADSFSKSEFAQITFAEFNAEKKNHIEAFKYFSRALQANPDSLNGLVGVSVSGFEIQKLPEALAAFEKICKLEKSNNLSLRRAINVLKIAKNKSWLEKYEQALDRCR